MLSQTKDGQASHIAKLQAILVLQDLLQIRSGIPSMARRIHYLYQIQWQLLSSS